METGTLIRKSPLRRKLQSTNGLLNEFDFPAIIAKLKRKQTLANGELKTVVLLKSPDKQILLTAMMENTEIDSFQANNSIFFKIMEGKVNFHTRKDSVILGQGQVFAIHENIKYRLITREKTILLMTITGGVLETSNY